MPKEATGYGAKKGQQIRGRLWRGGAGKFVGGPGDEELADIGLSRAQSDALLSLLKGGPVDSVRAEELRNLGLLSPVNKLTQYGKATAEALKNKDADEAKRLLGLAKPKGKGGGGGGGGKSEEEEREQRIADRKAVIARAVKETGIPVNLFNIFFDFADEDVQNPKEEMLAKVAELGLIELDKDGYYKLTAHGKRFYKAADQKRMADALLALEKAKQSMEAEESMNVGQIAKSAIEVALSVVNNSGEITKERAVKLLHALEADLAEVWQPGNGASTADVATLITEFVLVPDGAWTATELFEALTKKVSGRTHVRGDFLVVEDPEKVTTWHLPVKVNGTVNRRLMGAAKAALTSEGGFRGQQYAGPDKAKAIKKLKALYESEGMEWASEAETPPDGLRELLEQALALLPDETESFTESTASASGIEDYTGDLAELGVDIEVGEGRRAPVLVDFQILEPGPGNKKDNHYYPRPMVERDAHVFKGVDMFATDHQESERSERTKVGRVRECPTNFTESGAPVAQVVIYDPHQAEKTRNRADAGELATMECSIFARGISKIGEIDGHEYKVVEAITEGKYLELVSSAGAGGHALNLSEGGSTMNETENVTDGERIEEDIHESEPAPVEEPTEESPPGEGGGAAEPVEEAAPESLAEADVEAALAETNLPGAFKAALCKGEYDDADALKAAIDQAIAEVKELTGSGQPFGQGATQPVEVSGADLEQEAKDDFNRVMREVGLKEI